MTDGRLAGRLIGVGVTGSIAAYKAVELVRALRAEGADLCAVTAWSLFGAVDWDSTLRTPRGRYEAGAWDARTNPPRPTRLAAAMAQLAQTGQLHDPALNQPGWWRRQDRFHEAARSA